jgi:3-oxoacyl-[acyl-carrier-protein] synthase-1
LPPLNIAEPGASLGHPLRCAVSNSFAFGGANATLVLGRE